MVENIALHCKDFSPNLVKARVEETRETREPIPLEL